MTRRDYEIIAAAVNQTKRDYYVLKLCELTDTPEEVLDNVIAYLSMALEQDNPRFDRDKFVQACNNITEGSD